MKYTGPTERLLDDAGADDDTQFIEPVESKLSADVNDFQDHMTKFVGRLLVVTICFAVSTLAVGAAALTVKWVWSWFA